MRLAIVLFAVGLASCQAQHAAPTVVVPDAPTRVIKVTIPVTIDDDAVLCVEVTDAMHMDRVRDAEVCGLSVGELRKEFTHLSNAN